MPLYPLANYLLIEAQSVHERGLQAFCSRHRNAQYVLAAASEAEGQIYFDASDPWSGVASHVPMEHNCIQVPAIAIDQQVKERALPPPYLIKLDTHGFEVPILRGASQILSQTAVLIVECYNFPMAPPESLLFPDMCRYLAERGFRCIDLFDLLYRPRDDAFWQMDMLFMKSDIEPFSYVSYY